MAEISGASVDNKTKLELLKQEQTQIKLENAATEAAAAAVIETSQSNTVPVINLEANESLLPEKDFADQQLKKEILIDKATVIITANEAKEIGDIIER